MNAPLYLINIRKTYVCVDPISFCANRSIRHPLDALFQSIPVDALFLSIQALWELHRLKQVHFHLSKVAVYLQDVAAADRCGRGYVWAEMISA